jgi:hypothetical protein
MAGFQGNDEKEVGKSAAAFLLSPAGGLQAKKTLEGWDALQKGYVTNKSGFKRFDVEKTPGNILSALTLGKNATKEGREARHNNYYTLREDVSNLAKKMKEGSITKEEATQRIEKVTENGAKAGVDARKLLEEALTEKSYEDKVAEREKANEVVALIKKRDNEGLQKMLESGEVTEGVDYWVKEFLKTDAIKEQVN